MSLNISLNLISVINLLGIAQAIFFSAYLFQLNKTESKAHIFLALFLSAYALVQLNDVLEASNLFMVYPHLNSTFPILVFALGPLIYFYVKSLTVKNFKFKLKHLLHFTPLLLLILILIPYFNLSAGEKVKIIINETKHPDQDNTVSYIGIIQIMIYLVLSIKIIIGYSKDIKNHFSFTEKINLNWVLNLIVSLAIIWMLWFLDTRYPTNFLKYMEAGMFTFFIYFLGFKGIKQPEIFKKTAEPDNNILETESIIPSKKYEKTGISTEVIETAIARLTQFMETEKVYKNSQLTLSDLAVLTELPNHHLSQILNENLKLNFYDYVNKYRVEEVKRDLLNPQKNNFTILALALDAGFNSKASFNKAFKKHTGLSPSEFKYQHQNLSSALEK